MKKVSQLKQQPILVTADWDKADASALQAVASGDANEQQQKRALNWIVYKACRFNDLSFRPGAEDETAFAEGLRFAALQINALLTANLRTLED